MATGTSTSSPGVGPASTVQLVEYDRFIDKQLRRTRAQVRMVDVASGLLVLATGTLGYFLVVALVDHWAVPGGLPGWVRLAVLSAYVVAAGWYFLSRVVPLLIRRINPLYAAETIERTQPSLKNSLLNFLMFRARPQGLSESVYHAVEEQAASNLAHVPIETVVDRSKLIKIGYVLAGVLAVCALYKVFSPKDPLTSVGRIVMPWADILPPTRVTIENIQPGNSKAFRGQKLEISAEVRGLQRDGKVTLIYGTADGQTVDRPLEMHVPQDGYRHVCTLPPDEDGIQQTVQYRIVAGDARSRDYTISVVAAPTIVVDSVEYLYPEYTGLLTQKIDHQGDIKAIEGTRVIVHALTNQPIKAGGLDFECDEHEDLSLTVDGTGDLARGATATFSLALENDRVTSTHSSYQLRFRNANGDENQQPIRHTIEVIADLPPEIEFLAPTKDEVRVREGDVLPLELTANDPDFALKRVKLIADVDGRRLFDKSPIKSDWRGQFTHKFRLSTKEHKLKAGNVVEYWAVAEDIKSPQPNVVETAKRRIQIVARDAKRQPNQNQPDGAEQPPLEGEPDKAQKGEPGQAGKPSSEDNPQEGESQQSGQGERQNQSDGESHNQKGENSEETQPQGNQQQGEKRQPGAKQGDDLQENENKDGEQQQGANQGGKQDQADKQPGKPQQGGSGNQQSGDQKQTVPNDGSNDGEAFEKALKHLQEKEQQGSNTQDKSDGKTKNDNPGSQESKGKNKQTRGDNQGGQEKPSDKKPQPGEKQDDDSSDKGSKPTGERQPGQSGNSNAEKKPGEQGALDGQEQAGNASDDAKQGENSQKGEATEQGGKNAKKQRGQPGKNSQTEKIGEKEHDHQHAEDCPHCNGKGCDKCGGTGKSDGAKNGQAQSGNPRDQQGGDKSSQGGQGEHSQGDDKGGEKKPDGSKPQDKAKGGSEEKEKGESGAGRKSTTNEGAPEAQGDNLQKNKTPKPSAGEQDDEDKQEAQSPSSSNKQSDSKEGESEGDRSGSGKSGGGQKANQPGTGGAGKNTASDEGAGQSSEKGDGDTSGKAGSQQESNSPTGKSGNKAGQGSQSKPGDKSGKGDSSEKPKSSGSPSDKHGQQPGGPGDSTSRGTPQGGGPTGERATAPPSAKQVSEPGGDKADLEYARKATDLVLDRLRDQLEKGKPDQDLLDELGWTREDLKEFVRRWEQMRAAAREDNRKGEESKRELDATLRSLGLRPRGTTLSGNRAADDTQRELKESRRTSPPSDYAEQYKQYLQGTARGGK